MMGQLPNDIHTLYK